ncbi:cobaltochelatase subunit CobN [Prosthecomicrobium sp. N25]|uniref:cobaltochelatase subunit CobN n=1 Tax=Prosthecomicrobium sp. N25 TaxID=3129254 RepID=UPI0030776100
MHLLPQDVRTLDAAEAAEDLGQSPADLLCLSFSDSDLSALAAAWRTERRRGTPLPSLRLANLARLRHPYSVDLYLETVAAGARAIVIRCLGGADYWRYGVDELAALARARGIALAIVPGDHMEDLRLDRASTEPVEDLRRIWGWFQEGGPDNMASLVGWLSARTGLAGHWTEPAPVPAAGRFEAACRAGGAAGRALVIFYRSLLLAADTEPVTALADALAGHGLAVETLAVTSLKDPRAVAVVEASIAAARPDVIVNATAFSARLDGGGTVLDRAGAPVLQAVLPVTRREAWAASTRGLGAADLAMNVVLPELDGRIVTRAISFKAAETVDPDLQFAAVRHRPEAEAIEAVAALAAGWARLRRTPAGERRLALVLSDYPAKGGREGYAVGLDTPASVATIAEALRAAGYRVGTLPDGDALMAALTRRAPGPSLDLASYARLFGALPAEFREAVLSAWGDPVTDPDVEDGGFRFRVLAAGALAVAIQPDRGRDRDRKADYHDANLPPRHGYVAFHLWLRHVFRLDAMVHLGTHGTLEWLPGKAVAPSETCAPSLLAGPVPVIYPFIVNNPGEAGQAKRRIGAVTIGHMTPPLGAAGSHGAAAEIEALLEEYAEAQGLDPRRARLLADAILEKAEASGLAAESGLPRGAEPGAALAAIDAWICDLKEMRIGDGLHVFGRAPAPDRLAAAAAVLAEAAGAAAEAAAVLLDLSASSEIDGLLAALDGRFVPPGPAGAPVRGRLDVLPTGRNLTALDPRAIPTATAEAIGARTAAAVMDRYAQDHGEWPKRIVVDLWGSATMRTGGDDLAQALALLGVRPVRDAGSARVSGFEILPAARLERPRVDVTLRISGLFRDVFPTQVALFDEAARAVAALDEDDETNPLAAARRAAPEGPRVFGAAPGAYGTGLGDILAEGRFTEAADLGEAYLAASGFAYGAGLEGAAAEAAFRARVAGADAFVHGEDNPHQDILDSDAFATHTGGFAAAAAALGAAPALYHAESPGGAGSPKVRTLAEQVARVLRGRATNPRWIAGQMRHGHRGAAEIAETVGNLFAFAATTQAVTSRQFDLLYDATLGDETVRAFLFAANPEAARATARTFSEAHRRGYWQTRRNAPLAFLAGLGDAA